MIDDQINESRKNQMTQINGYYISKLIIETSVSCLFLANKVGADGKKDELSFLLKRYHKNIPKGILANEKAVSHSIKENCSRNIVIPILETVKAGDGYTYAVMQYEKQGMFLAELIEALQARYGKGRIPIHIVVNIIGRILDALSALHHFPNACSDTDGFLHLDLHPDNIFLENVDLDKEEWGNVRFIDFATAIPVCHTDHLYRRTWRSYTPGFSAPEMMSFLRGQIMESTDLYSIGMILKKFLFGEEDTSGSWHMDCQAAAYMLEQFLSIALQENSAYRYPSAQEMHSALTNIIDTIDQYREQDFFHYYQKAYQSLVPIERLRRENVEIREESYINGQKLLEENKGKKMIFNKEDQYIYDLLWEKGLPNPDISIRAKTQMALCGIMICNDIGQVSKAKELYRYIMEHNNQLTPNEYISILSKMHVCYADSGEYQKAYDIAQNNVRMLDAFYGVMGEVNGNTVFYNVDRGGNYSAMATYRCMMGLLDQDTLLYYERALQEFLPEDSLNRAITMSKIIHMSIMKNDLELYHTYRSSYFGSYGANVRQVLQSLLEDERYHAFEIFLLVKVIYYFHMDEVLQDNALQGIIYLLAKDKKLSQDLDFTRLLISRYLALIIYEMECKNMNAESMRLFRDSINALNLGRRRGEQDMNPILGISIQSEWIYNDILGNHKDNQKLLQYTRDLCKRSGWQYMVEQIDKEKTLAYLYKHEYS